ncbi:MAG: hypothetical protein ACO33C_04950 [Gammaproteobacteria bacterium]
MNIFIISIVLIFLIGSISLAMPSKQTKELAAFRLLAAKSGFRIETLSLKKRFKNFTQGLEIYTFKNSSAFKQGHFIFDDSGWNLYDPISLKKDPNFENLKKLINKFPKPILEIIFFESNIAFLWKEKKDLEMLEHIKSICN